MCDLTWLLEAHIVTEQQYDNLFFFPKHHSIQKKETASIATNKGLLYQNVNAKLVIVERTRCPFE